MGRRASKVGDPEPRKRCGRAADKTEDSVQSPGTGTTGSGDQEPLKMPMWEAEKEVEICKK